MSKQAIIELRQITGAGITDIQSALEEANGDKVKALELLRKRGQAKAQKKQNRETKEGVVHAYVHSNGRVGVLVEVACETDFVARNDDFKNFVHDLSLQIAAANPIYVNVDAVSPEVIEKEKSIIRGQLETDGKTKGKPEEMINKIIEGKLAKFYSDEVLLEQASIKDETLTIKDLLTEITAKVGEKIEIKRFVRYSIGA